MNPETTDRIIAAHRPTDADVDAELSPASRQRIIDDIVDAPAAVVPFRRRSRRLPMMVAAGTAVAALALGVQAILPGRVETVVTTDTSGGTATTTVTQAPAGLPAAVALEPVARAAAARPALQPKGSQFLRVGFTLKAGASVGATEETYISSDGWLWKKRFNTPQSPEPFYTVSDVPFYSGGSEGLPADPAAIRAWLSRVSGSASADQRVFMGIQGLLMDGVASPAVKGATIATLEDLAKKPQAPEVLPKRQGDPNPNAPTQVPRTPEPDVISTPKVTLERVTEKGQAAVKATLTDSTAQPGLSWSIVLAQETGDLLATEYADPGDTGRAEFDAPRLVDALPADVVAAVGTDRVAKSGHQGKVTIEKRDR